MNTQDLVAKANTVPLHRIVLEFFGEVWVEEGRSWKTFCPFAMEHGDGGIERNFRYYPTTNTAYCFEMHGFLNPVRLMAMRNEWQYRRTALYLLDHYDMLRNPDWQARWLELMQSQSKPLDVQPIVEALHTYIRSIGGAGVQYDPRFQRFFSALLDQLTAIAESNDEGQLRLWYEGAKGKLTEAVSRLHGGEQYAERPPGSSTAGRMVDFYTAG